MRRKIKDVLMFAARIVGVTASASALALIGGCAVPQGFVYPLRTAPEVQASQFENQITVVGAEHLIDTTSHFTKSVDARVSRYTLRSWLDKKTGEASHQLYVVQWYTAPDWRFWMRASDDAARALEFASIDRQVKSCGSVTGCSYEETFAASIPDSTLVARATTGYAVKFYAKSGDELVIRAAPAQIGAQLAILDSLRRAIGAP